MKNCSFVRGSLSAAGEKRECIPDVPGISG